MSEYDEFGEPLVREIEVFSEGTRPVTTYVPSFGWACGTCGWRGFGLSSEESAKAEGERHTCPGRGPERT